MVVARGGGARGRGNKRFASPTRRTPRFAETGLPGEEATFDLRLKLLADAALVGLPNAGKSSLLTRISNARPKVAEYPFTTLAPILGTVDAPDGTRQLTVADVPGLIEGASEGVGLGHEFLAHLERANLLLHVIDSSEDDAAERFARHRPRARGVRRRARDAPAGDRPEQDRSARGAAGFDVEDDRIVRVFRVSCATGAGIDELRARLVRALSAYRLRRAVSEDGLVDFLVYRPRPGGRRFRILRTDRGFRITGEAPSDEEELAAALKAAGARRGDEVEVDGEVLEVCSDRACSAGRSIHRTTVTSRWRARPASTSVSTTWSCSSPCGPGHKEVQLDAETRLRLAQAAFPEYEVELDPHERTVDMLKAGRWSEPLVPDRRGPVRATSSLGRTRRACSRVRGSAVATRPGFPRERLDERAAGAVSARSRRALRDRAASRSRRARSAIASPR